MPNYLLETTDEFIRRKASEIWGLFWRTCVVVIAIASLIVIAIIVKAL
jgi:hypothetical protein